MKQISHLTLFLFSSQVLLHGLRCIAVKISLKLSFEELVSEGVLELARGLELHTNTKLGMLYLSNSGVCNWSSKRSTTSY